jgi:hypothetical protein
MRILMMIDSISIANREVNDDELQEKLQSLIDNYHEPKPMIAIYKIHEDDFNALPAELQGLPRYYTVTNQGIKIWPRPDDTDIILYCEIPTKSVDKSY